MKKALYILGGWLAVLLGLIGIFVPGLPTTPFLLLASWLFYHSSEKMHRWLHTSYLGKYIRRYQQKQGVSWKTKLTSIGCMVTMMSISIFGFIDNRNVQLLVTGLGIIGVCCILFVVPSQKKE